VSSRNPTPIRNRVVGALTVVFFVGLAVFAYKFYKGDINPGVQVTLRTGNAGLLLDPQSKVSVKGVQVGTVRSVTSEGGQAVVHMDLKPDKAKHLPANVVADLRPTTLFGAKYVNLVLPAKPVAEPLAEGDVITQRYGSKEADQVFQNVMTLLNTVQPRKVNDTLTALSGALDGRGEQLGDTITRFNTYLVGLLPSMPQLTTDLKLANKVMPTYQQAAPDLIQAMDNFRTTSVTLTSKSQQLSRVLSGVSQTGGEATALLIDASPALTGTVREFKPVAFQLKRYSPMLTCLLQGMAKLPGINPPNPYPGLWADAALLPRARPYQYPRDLPQVAEDSGPHCFGLPNITENSYVPHYDFKTGTSPFPDGVSTRNIR
jgi:phospholipid/cholesterol/gamma-HCH transport system substrate-binding protein